MLKVNIERIGDVAIIHCEGRVVQSAAAFRLREAVTQQKDARVILLDLSDVQSLESGGLGMLPIFATMGQRPWHTIQGF